MVELWAAVGLGKVGGRGGTADGAATRSSASEKMEFHSSQFSSHEGSSQDSVLFSVLLS